MRTLFICLLAFTIPAHSLAAVTHTDILTLMKLVDEYVAETSTKPKDAGVFYEQGQQEYFAQAVAAQVNTLESEDFNLFLLDMMSRYVNRPHERDALFRFIKAVRETIKAELEETERLREGPAHSIIAGMEHYFWVLLAAGAVINRSLWMSPLRKAAFVQKYHQLELAAAKWRPAYRLGYRFATNPITVSAIGGATMGALEYLLETYRTRRMDPVEILNIVQTQIACDLSYKGLEQEEALLSALKDESVLRGQYETLKKELNSIHDQAEQLEKQFPRLDNLTVGENQFKAILSRLPPARNFQDLRRDLTESNKPEQGRCRAVAMNHLVIETEKMQSTLKAAYDNLAPSTGEPTPEGNGLKP